jgi:LysR family transcriptional regulator, glycine cleavage system transcriptional activator
MAGRNRLTKPADLLKAPLLHLDDSKAWSEWFDAAGVTDADTSHGLTRNRESMVIDAAGDGQGVALARTTLAAWDLINGRLVRPFDLGLKLARTYWILCPKATSTKPKVATFRDWLLAEAADDARRLRKIFAANARVEAKPIPDELGSAFGQLCCSIVNSCRRHTCVLRHGDPLS